MGSVWLPLLCLAAISLAICSVCEGKVMMEYIGVTGVPASFSNVPIKPHIDFNFVLGFAIDANSHGVPQNGSFTPYWHSSITPAAVRLVKSRHSNVKVLASLSGWSIGEKILRWYNPKNAELWISNAFKSLQTIVNRYNLDGIDISYEVIRKNDTTFVHCIGQLITRLKRYKLIKVATISPYFKTAQYYTHLYQQYGNIIDYVNYQFYIDHIQSPDDYVNTFKLQAVKFSAAKLLPSYEINGRGIQGDGFFEALKLLKYSRFNVSGVVIYSADASKSTGYYYEKKAQGFLLNPKSF